ncbi:MAG: SAM-dependent methyltransferase [Rhodospirillales bacterium]|nr:SAM-dependent methyltransferase [Rhodospirillales bacterium]MDP6804906.1 SAM-dependent methyltransferase [Rhodospirillales bacterium]
MADLDRDLRRLIAHHGPLSVAEYMAAVLVHPRSGVYTARDPIGADGDFITAPEVSQVFGELISAWCRVVWRAIGAPDPTLLVELGPGRGALMADFLRVSRTDPKFHRALRLWLVEASPAMCQLQRRALGSAEASPSPSWTEAFARVPDGAVLLVANEFFDALPVHQFQMTASGWNERRIDEGANGTGLRFVLSAPSGAAALIPASLASMAEGSVVEVSPARIALASQIGERVAHFGGAALIVDYGACESRTGDTLRAMRKHAFHPVLADPGTADISAHVDFAGLAQAATEAGARVFGPIAQGPFLERLGAQERARTLIANATPEVAAEIQNGLHRLVDAQAMGALFKAVAIVAPGAPPPPGFE